ncbi:hypothetical protein [Verrucomicrobium spinosum]|uniref:hypothetical protein n=1 Tax=Verrucomicrobium spinosum TaxID=2736 RepID=UPI0001744E38|nr:hypothetical protein [Verrucomicrobium spinosum]
MGDAATDLKKQVTDYLATVFPETQGNEGWSLRVSMPFPQSWNGQPTPTVWYAYADRSSTQSPNGVEVSQAWATVTQEADPCRPLQLVWLQKGIVPLGFQGPGPSARQIFRWRGAVLGTGLP